MTTKQKYRVSKEINSLSFDSQAKEGAWLQKRMRRSLVETLELGIELASALRGYENNEGEISSFRIANMIRHHLVPLPIASFLDFDGDLLNLETINEHDLNVNKVKFSPRFVNFDECLTLYSKKNPKANFRSNFESALKTFQEFNGFDLADGLVYDCPEDAA